MKRLPRLASAIELLGVVAEDVGRRLVEQRLDRLEDLVDVVVERVVGVRVVRAVARDLLLVLGMILAHQQVVAVLLRAERGRHEDRHEAVLDQLEVLDDVRPEQAERVREGGEPEAGSQLLGDRRAADEMPALEDERAQAGLGEVGAVGQAVVAATDDDRVVGPVRLRRSWPAVEDRVAAFSGWSSLACQAVLRSGLKQRRTGDDRIEVVVAVVDRHLELHPRARRRPVERHAGEGDVALEHRRVHLARGVAELVEVVVVDVVLVLDRRVVLGRDEPRLVVDPIVVAPVDDEPAQLPARRPAGELARGSRRGR